MLLLFSSLFGSAINLPLFTVQSTAPDKNITPSLWQRGLLHHQQLIFNGRTLIAINVGGCLIPVFFTLYLLNHHTLPLMDIFGATACVTVICHTFSRPIPGLGIGMPILIAPVSAALAATVFNAEHSAALAYISGTLGVLIGADLLRMKNIRQLGAPIASIGGAGTFDGIFITGIVAVLLA